MDYRASMEIRRLSEDDRRAVEAFLLQHRDSSMFLRSNIHLRGFEDSGQPFEATYLAAIDAGQIVGIIGHAWNGMLLVQTPAFAEPLVAAVVRESGRAVTGISGPRDQVQRVREALDLGHTRIQLDEAEDLYGVELEALRVPAPSAGVVCRAARPEDRDALVRFRIAYDIEALGGRDDDAAHASTAMFLDAQLEAGRVWVAVANGRLVSLSAFNAALPDIVQLGGIYTPPEHRGRGYAKLAVTAQLLAARAAGATRSVLFTKNPSAVRCYTALGFERLSEFALVLLEGA